MPCILTPTFCLDGNFLEIALLGAVLFVGVESLIFVHDVWCISKSHAGKVPGFYYVAQNRENLTRLRLELRAAITIAMALPDARFCACDSH